MLSRIQWEYWIIKIDEKKYRKRLARNIILLDWVKVVGLIDESTDIFNIR